MNSVLSELIGNSCLVYLEHNSKLRDISQKLHGYNLKIEPDKCAFLKEELSYLGHAVTAAGDEPDSQKMATVVELPTPQSNGPGIILEDGRRFTVNFSAIARSLTDPLKKDTKW
jgi:hypothetical protein